MSAAFRKGAAVVAIRRWALGALRIAAVGVMRRAPLAALMVTIASMAHASAGVAPLSDRGGVLVVRRAARGVVDRYDPSLPTPLLPADTVRAGERVVVTWKPTGLVEECELMLSVDGGRTFPLRISPTRR